MLMLGRVGHVREANQLLMQFRMHLPLALLSVPPPMLLLRVSCPLLITCSHCPGFACCPTRFSAHTAPPTAPSCLFTARQMVVPHCPFSLPSLPAPAQQWYTSDPSNVRVEGDCLVLQAQQADASNPWSATSGRISTLDKFSIAPSAQFGTVRIEARMKVPRGARTGMPAPSSEASPSDKSGAPSLELSNSHGLLGPCCTPLVPQPAPDRGFLNLWPP